VKSLIAVLALAARLCAQASNAPAYTAAGVVNGASFTASLAPNTIGSIFGTNLSWNTTVVTSTNMSGGEMPTNLGNVSVYFEGWPAYIYYVSPKQINFLVPSTLLPGTFQLWVDRQGTRGPIVNVTLDAGAPAMFEYPAGTAIATHTDGSLVSTDAPATAGEIVTLWATGLGNTNPPLEGGVLPNAAQWLDPIDQFAIWINGSPIDSSRILYAGVAPHYAGLYQVNVRLPEQLPPMPEIRMALGTSVSPAGMILPAK